MSSERWKQITPSQFPWEREALDFVRERLPDIDPYRAWANFEFIADDGTINEVDLLVLTPRGFFLIEIKSRPGTLSGDRATWVWESDRRSHTEDNPIILTNRKAKKLISLLKRQKVCQKIRVPYLDPLVFCSHEALDCRLQGVDRYRICLRDTEKTAEDFFRFEFRARYTVGLGDVPRLDDERAVKDAVDRAGAGDVVARLASGLDTQLGPTWPCGVELSFGQWQKLALARGFMRDEPLLLVLDEPTAALDAETEHALFERYAAATRAAAESNNGRITILVSHRFSTVRMADLIIVLDGARLVEVGTHQELMTKSGQYSELYGIQAAAYR